MQKTKYIKIQDKYIPIVLRNYKNAKYLKMYFKANILYISKPQYVSIKKVIDFIKENEKYIYEKYTKIDSNQNMKLKQWDNEETFFYKGEKYKINVTLWEENKISINIKENTKTLELYYPEKLSIEERKSYIDKGIKKILKNNTEHILYEKLLYWSKKTNISYNQFKVNDATSKFGSCIPSTKKLHFSSRLVMLPEDKIDAIIVHELCHIIYPNHSQNFYNLLKEYIPNYDEINKWLKRNGTIIIF